MRLLFDLETSTVDFDRGDWLDSIEKIHCLVILDLDTNNIEKFYDTTGLRELGTGTLRAGIEKLGQATELAGHNIIQFDVPVLRRLHGFRTDAKITDTLVISRTLYPDRPGGHSLESWGTKLGYPKLEFNEFEEFTLDMLEYCRRDVELNGRVYKTLEAESNSEAWRGAIDTEHKFAKIITEQEQIGFYFDTKKAERLVKEWEEEIALGDNAVFTHCALRVEPGRDYARPFKINGDLAKRVLDACATIRIDPSTIGGPFSTFDYKKPELESKQQQKDLLLSLGWKPVNFTPTGAPKLCDSIKSVPVVGEILHRRNMLSHRRSQVQGLLDQQDRFSRVHGGGNPCGTNTGRMRHSRIVNIPRVTSPLGKELRSLFTVPANKRLVGYDAAALELRILAHYIGDEDYVRRVTTTDKSENAHTLAAEAAGVDSYDTGKTINYALIYGAGDAKLGSIIGGDVAEGQKLRDALYSKIPGFESLVTRAKGTARRGWLLGLDGRRLYLRKRVSPLNTLIQGGGAIFMKTVAIELDELAKDLQSFKVIDMHDEAQWECPPSEVATLSDYVHQAFDRATAKLNLRCPMEAEVKVGKTWMETH